MHIPILRNVLNNTHTPYTVALMSLGCTGKRQVVMPTSSSVLPPQYVLVRPPGTPVAGVVAPKSLNPKAALTPKPIVDSPTLPGKAYPPAGPIKKILGLLISAVSLVLTLVSMGMMNVPKVPLLSAPFFAMVFGAFAANEALALLADKAKIPTIHHSESLRRVLTAPGYAFSKQVLERAWPMFFGGVQEKRAYIQKFAQTNEALVEAGTRIMVKNPMFEDLSLKLRDKRGFSEKAGELSKSFGKVMVALAASMLMPKPLRATLGPWLTNAMGFPLLERMLAQLDQDPSTPGVQLTKPKMWGGSVKQPTKPLAMPVNPNKAPNRPLTQSLPQFRP
jgi:hypothetical protein